MVQLTPDVGQAKALGLEALDLFDDQEVVRRVAALAALGALGDNDAFQLLFPEAEGVGGNPGALAHFLYGKSLHLSIERGALRLRSGSATVSREQKRMGHGFTQITADYFTAETAGNAEKDIAGSKSTWRMKPKTK